MIPEFRQGNHFLPILIILAPGFTLVPATCTVSSTIAIWIGLAWLINLTVFIPPWLVIATIPRLRSAPVILLLSGFRLVCLPMVLFAVKNQMEEIAPPLLGWTLGLYVLNLISMTVMESRIRA